MNLVIIETQCAGPAGVVVTDQRIAEHEQKLLGGRGRREPSADIVEAPSPPTGSDDTGNSAKGITRALFNDPDAVLFAPSTNAQFLSSLFFAAKILRWKRQLQMIQPKTGQLKNANGWGGCKKIGDETHSGGSKILA